MVKNELPFRLISGLLISVPALMVGAAALLFVRDEYYRLTYWIACAVFLFASFILGFLFPANIHKFSFLKNWFQIFISGTFAWLISLTGLAFLNLTPLCVGQDNGDGINDFGLCIGYTILISMVYSPLILALLALNAAVSGLVIRKRNAAD